MKKLLKNWESIGIAGCIVLINLIVLNQIGIAYGRYDWMLYLGAYGVYDTDNPVASLTSIDPNAATAGSVGFTLILTGTNFISNSVVRWNGSDRTTTFVSGTQLQATIAAADIATAGVAYITVFNPAPGGGTSSRQALYITPTGAGVTASNTATGSNPSATTGSTNGITAIATGTGTVSVAQYAANPGGTPSFNSAGAYVDVHIASGSTFTSLTIVDCNMNGGNVVLWWNGIAWILASNQTYNAGTGCVTIVVNNSTSPRLTDLTGTPFGAARGGQYFFPIVMKGY